MDNTRINISLDKTLPMYCEKCEHNIFTEGVLLRRVPKFFSGTPEDSILPIPVFYCAKCGHVNSEFLPPSLTNSQTNENGKFTSIATP
jgi:hypothetical protein